MHYCVNGSVNGFPSELTVMRKARERMTMCSMKERSPAVLLIALEWNKLNAKCVPKCLRPLSPLNPGLVEYWVWSYLISLFRYLESPELIWLPVQDTANTCSSMKDDFPF